MCRKSKSKSWTYPLSSFVSLLHILYQPRTLNHSSYHHHRHLSREGYASCLTALVANNKNNMKTQAQMASFVVVVLGCVTECWVLQALHFLMAATFLLLVAVAVAVAVGASLLPFASASAKFVFRFLICKRKRAGQWWWTRCGVSNGQGKACYIYSTQPACIMLLILQLSRQVEFLFIRY